MKLFSVAEMVEAEKEADKRGHTYATMMTLAGRGVADAVMARRNVRGLNIFVLVGPGNNGGDGLVAGRYLAEAGANVTFYLHKKRGDENFKRLLRLKVQILHREHDNELQLLAQNVASCHVLLDAMLGTGVTRPIGGDLAQVFSQILAVLRRRSAETLSRTPLNAASTQHSTRPFVVAVDCPSGLHCNTGIIDPLALSADLSVTFAGPKRGHFIFPGAAHCGVIDVIDIGIASDIVAHLDVEVATAAKMRSWLPPRPADGHKGTFGSVMIAGGSADYLGAPILSARGALRAGSGLVGLAIPQAIRTIAATQLPEATYPRLASPEYLDAHSAEILLAKLDGFKALLVGPGLGTQSDTFLDQLLAAPNLPPLVIDADALNYLARQPDWPKMLPANCILTPHPGEMGRLVGQDAPTLERVALAQTYAEQWQQIVVLKGAYTVVARPDRDATVIPIATPLLAVAGSGDVLAGVIVSLLGQGMDAYQAAVLGAYLHASAGQTLAQSLGNAGLLAHQIAEVVPTIRGQLDGTLT